MVGFLYQLAIVNVCNNTCVNGLSPDGGTELFEMLAGVLQGDTLFMIVLDYALRPAIDGCEEERRMHRRYRSSVGKLIFHH